MKRKKLNHLPDGQPREAGPHGKTLDMIAIKRPEPTYIKQFLTEPVKSMPGMFRKIGDWTPHTNPERDNKRHARLRRDAS